MEFTKIPLLQIGNRAMVPTGTSADEQASPNDGEVYADTDLSILKVAFNGVYQQLNGLPIGDEQTASGNVKAGYIYPVNTKTQAITLTIEADADDNSRIGFYDPEGSWGTNNFTLRPAGGEEINGSTDDIVFSQKNASATYVRASGDRYWRNLMSTASDNVIRGLNNLTTITASQTLQVTYAYNLDFRQKVSIENASVNKFNQDYSAVSGTATVGTTTSVGPFYYKGVTYSTVLILKVSTTRWIVINTDDTSTWVANSIRTDHATPLSIDSWGLGSGTDYTSDDLTDDAADVIRSSYTLTLPDSTANRDAIYVGDIWGCADGCNITLASSTQTINFDRPFQWMMIQYVEASSKWVVSRGGVLQDRNVDRPGTLSAETINEQTHRGHTHELEMATSAEVTNFSSTEIASLEQIRQALAARGFMWTPGTDNNTLATFPASSVNTKTIPAGDYRVVSSVTGGPATNGILYHRYINDSKALQIFQGYDDNHLWTRVYPDTTTWEKIIDATDFANRLDASKVHIGLNAGASGQGVNAVAIGNNAAPLNQPANSIMIAANGGTSVVPSAAGDIYLKTSSHSLQVTSEGLIIDGVSIYSTFFESYYPVGSFVFNKSNSNNPKSYLVGGSSSTWVAVPGRALIGVGSVTDANSTTTTFAANSTGGVTTVTLATSQIPAHSHTGSTASAGGHTHTYSGTSVSAGAHTHTLDATAETTGAHTHAIVIARANTNAGKYAEDANGEGDSYENNPLYTQSAGDHTHTITGTALSAGAHTHTYSGTTATSGAHTHTVSVGNTGGGGAHTNMMPYQTVYMWVRTA